MSDYDINRYFEYLGYCRGDVTYTCEGQRGLTVYCRGDRAQMERLLDPTPFALADDRFKITVADFSNNTLGRDQFSRGVDSFLDAGVSFAVEYGGVVGTTYYYEWENLHETVTAGREVHGYPKRLGKISLEDDDEGAHGRVTLEGELIMDVKFDYDESRRSSGGEGYPKRTHAAGSGRTRVRREFVRDIRHSSS
ncbi:MAG: acetoacetate decarboxylase family protein [Luteolibacter sp.]